VKPKSVTCAKTAEPINLPFWSWTWVDQRNTSSVIFTRWHQCALPWGYIGATWRIQLYHLSVAAMQPYFKLLWPLVIIIIRLHHSTTYVGVAYCYCPSSMVCQSVGLSQ